MLTASQSLLNKINQSQSYVMSTGCWLEYSMNDLIAGTTVTNTGGDTKTPAGDYTPFIKLFPLTSIINPKRPTTSGIKYFVMNSSVPEVMPTYTTSANMPYRLYYPGNQTVYKYWISNRATGNSLDNAHVTVTYPANKTAAVNKITTKFEVSHSKPTAWTIEIADMSGNFSTVSTNASIPDNGVVHIYYDGTSWSTTEFSNPSAPINISAIRVSVTSISVANSYLGIIEIAGKLVIDVTSRIERMQAIKQSSDSPNGITPVGNVTANSLSLTLNCYDGSAIEYDKNNPLDKTKINLFKNVSVKPFYVIDSEKIKIGTFYMDSFTVSEFGDVDVTSLDGAKVLQEIITPNILMKDTTSQAIIRRLLDGVGFTNYNFNSGTSDKSIITPYYWFSDNTQTVWQHIQDLCKDTQMIAAFDENNILQFYTREYLFDPTKTSVFKLRSTANSGGLANILTATKETVPSTKAVKILYSSWNSGAYGNSADTPYTHPASTIGAAALTKSLLSSAGAGQSMFLNPTSIHNDVKALDATSGWVLIQDEIIEYDALKYMYKQVNTNAIQEVWISDPLDIVKYQADSIPGGINGSSSAPTGEYRIKTRGAFGTTVSDHLVDLNALTSEWTGYVFDTTAKSATATPGLFSLKSSDALNGANKSLMTIDAPAGSTTKYAFVSQNAKYLDSTKPGFIIGTSLYFPDVIDPKTGLQTGNNLSNAGIAFSLNDTLTSGYLFSMQTIQAQAAQGISKRTINLYKITNGVLTALTDTQKQDSPMTINGGDLYRVDIKVYKQYDGYVDGKKITSNTPALIFKISINNNIITAYDLNPGTLTEKIALCSLQNRSAFDYVYTSAITKTDWESSSLYNLYAGFMGTNASITNYFSGFVLSKGTVTDNPTPAWVREFGPTAREIRKVSANYNTRPSLPRYPVVNMNPYVTLLGYTMDSFGIEAYLLNNSGTFVPIADGQNMSFIVVGDSLNNTDQFTYIDPSVSTVDTNEQIGFNATWIQKESEAKQLSDWMMTQWSKNQLVVTLDIFANPLLQIGDLVEISYPNAKLYSSEDTVPSGYLAGKYIILDITQTLGQDYTTSITCRSIYTG